MKEIDSDFTGCSSNILFVGCVADTGAQGCMIESSGKQFGWLREWMQCHAKHATDWSPWPCSTAAQTYSKQILIQYLAVTSNVMVVAANCNQRNLHEQLSCFCFCCILRHSRPGPYLERQAVCERDATCDGVFCPMIS